MASFFILNKKKLVVSFCLIVLTVGTFLVLSILSFLDRGVEKGILVPTVAVFVVLYYALTSYPLLKNVNFQVKANSIKVPSGLKFSYVITLVNGYLFFAGGVIILLLTSFRELKNLFKDLDVFFMLLYCILISIVGLGLIYYSRVSYNLIQQSKVTDTEAEKLTSYECIHCGHEQNENFDYCPKCGKNDQGVTNTSVDT